MEGINMASISVYKHSEYVNAFYFLTLKKEKFRYIPIITSSIRYLPIKNLKLVISPFKLIDFINIPIS